jgi:hypothetical protein
MPKGQWGNLKKRHCDNCGELYRPKQPIRPGELGFCSPNHRKEYHKHGGAFGPLRRALEKRIKALSPADALRIREVEKRLDAIEQLLRAFRELLKDQTL